MSKKVSWTVISAFAATLVLPSMAIAENTISQPISRIQYDGVNLHLWATGPASWGAASCPNANFIIIHGDVTGRKELLAIILAAKASGQSVRFAGNCHPDPDYFSATYVFVD